MNRYRDLCTISGSGGHVELTRGGRIVLITDGPSATAGDAADVPSVGDTVDEAVGSGDGPATAVERLVELGHGHVVVVDPTPDATVVAVRGDVIVGWIVDDVERFTRPIGLETACIIEVPDGAVELAVALGSSVPHRGQSLELSPVDGLGPAAASRVHVDLVSEPPGRPLPPPPPPRPTPPPPPPAVSAPPAASPPDGMELVNLTVTAVGGTPLPIGSSDQRPDVQVLGVRCPLDHHNHPDAEYCSSCGRKLGVNATAVLVQGPRPPVGLLLTRSGEAIPLAGDLLIGREPTSHGDVVAGRSTPVHIDDHTHVVSRHHLAVTLEGWDVFVRDLGSANGTILVSGRTGLERRLTPDEVVMMEPDDEIRLGEHSLHLALHHVARR